VYDFNTEQYLAMIPPTVNAGSSELRAINPNGVACGTRTIDAVTLRTTAFTINAHSGTIFDLGLINGQSTTASDINANS
jgi:hypothetical protein